MPLDVAVLAEFAVAFEAARWIRCSSWEHRATPLGMGYGDTRFASPAKRFQLLYLAEDLATSVAEAILRDRFETGNPREIMRSEVDGWGACEVSTTRPITMLDLRGDACFVLGVSTDIVGAKDQDRARELSQSLYDETDLDGIIYRSRLRKGCDYVAVYDRAVPCLEATSVAPLEAIGSLLPALETLRVDLIS